MADDEDILDHIADQAASNSLALHALAHDYRLYRRRTEAEVAELKRQLEGARALVRRLEKDRDMFVQKHQFEPYKWDATRCGYVDGDDVMCGYPESAHPTSATGVNAGDGGKR